MIDEMYHTPVLTKKVVEFLNCGTGGIFVDVTLGGGGWSEAILEACGSEGRVIGFDRDRDAIESSTERLKKYSKRFTAMNAAFSNVGNELRGVGVLEVDGIVADLGVSSHQLETAERGFSFMQEARLDMRMNRDQRTSAYDLVNKNSEKQLADMFFEFGEERFSRRIARLIVAERKNGPIDTTKQLADIVIRSVPPFTKRGKIHPATRVFQALRIVVNNELGELKSLVEDLPGFLKVGGRFVVVSYHSLEDRIVKQTFVKFEKEGDFRRVVKKPLSPEDTEIDENRRARSARLRVLERVVRDSRVLDESHPSTGSG